MRTTLVKTTRHDTVWRQQPLSSEGAMEKHFVTKMGVLQTQVCSEGTWDESLDWLRRTNPAGTENNWQKDERPEVAPVTCEAHPERKHYLFNC